jgi:hypothetical protein
MAPASALLRPASEEKKINQVNCYITHTADLASQLSSGRFTTLDRSRGRAWKRHL